MSDKVSYKEAVGLLLEAVNILTEKVDDIEIEIEKLKLDKKYKEWQALEQAE